MSIFSKTFSTLLDTRIRTWAEQNSLLLEYQFGFRKGKSTIDCVFVLSSIINKVLNHENKKLYCAFIDFPKAFDVVYRNRVWLKMIRYGASLKVVKILKSTYEDMYTI